LDCKNCKDIDRCAESPLKKQGLYCRPGEKFASQDERYDIEGNEFGVYDSNESMDTEDEDLWGDSVYLVNQDELTLIALRHR
jgi:hypothetical protein